MNAPLNSYPDAVQREPRPARQQTRILFAISEKEKNLFLPQLHTLSFPGTHSESIDRKLSPDEWTAFLEEYRPDVLVSCWSTPRLPEVQNGHLPIKYACHLTGTIRHLIPRSFIEAGGLVTNWGPFAAPQVAEHALLLTLAALRNIESWKSVIRGRKQDSRHASLRADTQTLIGRQVGIHGFGNVARHLIRLLAPFEVTIRCYSAGVPHELIEAAGAIPCGSLEEVAAQSQIFVECEALTPASQGSVTGEVLALIPNAGVFVNVGRGEVVDEDALYREANSGRIRMALDVLVGEVPPDNPFLGLPGVTVSPHIAGPTRDRFLTCGELAMQNIQRYLDSKPLKNLVTLNIFDRAT